MRIYIYCFILLVITLLRLAQRMTEEPDLRVAVDTYHGVSPG